MSAQGTKNYTEEQKVEALVRLKQPGATTTSVGFDMDIDKALISRWRREREGYVRGPQKHIVKKPMKVIDHNKIVVTAPPPAKMKDQFVSTSEIDFLRTENELLKRLLSVYFNR